MRQNIFMGGGFFGSRRLPVVGPALGQARYPVEYPDPYATLNDLRRKFIEAREAGDEEMARFYQHQFDELNEMYPSFISLPPPPPPAPPPRRFSPRNIPQGAYSWNQSAQPIQYNPSQVLTRPTNQPMAAGGSDVHCYYCEGLPDFPTYWMSESQAAQWNKDRDARCNQVNSSECQKKYNQMQADQQVNVRRAGFNAFNLPGATTYAPAMSGRIPVQNPGLIG